MATPLSLVLQIAALLLAVSVHESAHGWVALRCGDPTARDLRRISLNPLRHLDPVGSLLVPIGLALAGAPVFGWARPVPISLARTRDPRRANLLISAAGPLSNLLLAAVFAVAATALRSSLSDDRGGLATEIAFFFSLYAVIVNVALAVFNLLPIPPLDGFGVLESVLPPAAAPLTLALRRWGMLVLLLVLMSGALRSILGPAQRLVIDWLLGRR